MQDNSILCRTVLLYLTCLDQKITFKISRNIFLNFLINKFVNNV